MAAFDEVDLVVVDGEGGIEYDSIAVVPGDLTGFAIDREQFIAADLVSDFAAAGVVPSGIGTAPEVGPRGGTSDGGADDLVLCASDIAPVPRPGASFGFGHLPLLDHRAVCGIDLPESVSNGEVQEVAIGTPVAAIPRHVEAFEVGDFQCPENRAIEGIDGDDTVESLQEESSGGGEW